MSDSTVCRLCGSNCHSFFRLHDADGQTTHIFDVIIMFFPPKLLKNDKDSMNSIAILCQECWQHISEFHSFRQKILMLQEDLIENVNKIISQLPCNSLSSNLEEYFCAVDAHPADQVQTECEIKLEPIPDLDIKTSPNQHSSSSDQLTQTVSAKHVSAHLIHPDDIISGDDKNSMTQEDTTIKIEKEIFDMYDDVDDIIFGDDEQHAIIKEEISIDIKDELFEICDADANAIKQEDTSIKVKDELFDICDPDEIIYKEDENSMTQEDRSIKIRKDLFDICDNEIKPEKAELLEMSTEELITVNEIITEDENFEIETTERQFKSHKFYNNNRFVKIGNIRTSVQKISSIKPTIRRDVISTNCQNSSDNSDDSNQDDEENAPTRKSKNTFGSAMVDATIARWKPELDCDICSEKFSLYSEIKSHYRRRHRITLSEETIGGVSKKRCIIEEYARVHNDPKSFQCKDCGKCFTGKLFLEDHSNCHLPGGRQYKHICDICGKNYRLQSALLEHYVIHMGKKINHCKYCDKKFKYRSHLYHHMNNVHPDKVEYRTEHKCTLCPRIFKYATVLNRHILNEHSESLAPQMEKVKQ